MIVIIIPDSTCTATITKHILDSTMGTTLDWQVVTRGSTEHDSAMAYDEALLIQEPMQYTLTGGDDSCPVILPENSPCNERALDPLSFLDFRRVHRRGKMKNLVSRQRSNILKHGIPRRCYNRGVRYRGCDTRVLASK